MSFINNNNRFNLLLKNTNSNTTANTTGKNATRNHTSTSSSSNNSFGSSSKVTLDSDYKTNRFVSKHVNEERNKKQKEEKFIKSLDSLTEFPELQIKKKDTDNSHNSDNSDNKNKPKNFLDIVNVKNITGPNDEEIIDENEQDNDNDKIVPPGCVSIEYDKLTKQEIWSYGINVNNSEETKLHDEPVIVFQRLIDLYRVRKHEYINRWGIDEYDKMFMFQNYDYDYFDKLDEETEKCIKKHYQNAHIMNYNNNYNNNYEIL
jgi:hypothetical protein